MKNDITIGKLAKTVGIGVETVRFYERKGLIEQPLKPQSGFRLYPAQTITRLRFIRQAQELGFSLKEISELLALRATPDAECGDVREHAVAKLTDVNHKIKALEQIRSALTQVIETCPGEGDLTCCSIIEAIEGTPAKAKTFPPLSRSASTLTVAVVGMTCYGCEKRLSQALLKAPAIATAHASHTDGVVTVTCADTDDGEALHRAQVCELIEKAGFTPID